MTKRKTPVISLLATLFCIAPYCAGIHPARPSAPCPNRDAFIPLSGLRTGSANDRPIVHVQISPRLDPAAPTIAIAGERIVTAGARIARITKLRPGPPYTVVLYADLNEYTACQLADESLPETMGRYDSRLREFHVPATAREQDWRHEWVHALLADHDLSAPYWLHEGLAILLEETDQLERSPQLPARMLELRDAVRRHVAAGGLVALLERRSPGRWAAPTAAFFCAYLSEQGRLTAAIANDNFIHKDRTPEEWQTSFLEWLSAPLEP